ncbi:MAG TPA: vWA domain-containing protein [Steroidobacteraceae bacterium]|jgi:mxaL protein
MNGARGLFTGWDRGSGIVVVALVLLLLGLITPTVQLPRATFDYIVVFDISQSMNVEDYEIDGVPVSRLIYARNSAKQALRALPCGSRVGWGAFTGSRTLLLLAPVETCANYNDLLASLDKIDGRMRWSNASEISKGVYWAMQAAQETGSAPNIVFVTDGQESPPLESGQLPTMLDDLRGSPIHGWLVGAGSDALSPIPREDEDGTRIGFWHADQVIQSESSMDGATPGLEHLSALREQHLQTVASRLDLNYARLADESSLGKAMRDSRFARRRPVPTDLSWLAAAVALLLLVVRLRPEFRSRNVRRRAAA